MTGVEYIKNILEDFFDGRNELPRFTVIQCARECCKSGVSAELHACMIPYYSMYLDDSPRLDWTSRNVIADIAHVDPHFCEWVSHQDLMKTAHAWSTRGSGDDFLVLLDCMIQGEYETLGGEECYAEVTEELRYQRVNGNGGSGEIYALLHAFISVVHSSHRYAKHKELFLLLKNHWDFLRHIYSVMTGSIIGFGFSNFVGLANNLKSSKYHPYIHLAYWFLADNADTLCTKKQQKGMIKALTSLQEIMDRTEPNHDLDELCQLLFPEKVKEMLIKHPKTPYRQLESENKVLKVENRELKAEKTILNEKLNSLAKKQEEITLQMANELQKAIVDDAIPFKEIEEELLQLPAQTVGSVFSILNDMLGGNEVWQRNFRSLRTKVRKREKEKDVPLQATNVQGDLVITKNVDNEVEHVAKGGTGILCN